MVNSRSTFPYCTARRPALESGVHRRVFERRCVRVRRVGPDVGVCSIWPLPPSRGQEVEHDAIELLRLFHIGQVRRVVDYGRARPRNARDQ